MRWLPLRALGRPLSGIQLDFMQALAPGIFLMDAGVGLVVFRERGLRHTGADLQQHVVGMPRVAPGPNGPDSGWACHSANAVCVARRRSFAMHGGMPHIALLGGKGARMACAIFSFARQTVGFPRECSRLLAASLFQASPEKSDAVAGLRPEWWYSIPISARRARRELGSRRGCRRTRRRWLPGWRVSPKARRRC